MYFLSINYYMRYCNARDALFPLRNNGLSRDCAGSGTKIRILFYHNCNFHQQYDDFAKKKMIIDTVKHRQIFSVVCDGPASIWTNPVTFGIHHGILILGPLLWRTKKSNRPSFKECVHDGQGTLKPSKTHLVGNTDWHSVLCSTIRQNESKDFFLLSYTNSFIKIIHTS